MFDALVRRVAVLAEGLLAAGTHRLALDAGALPPGLYVVRAVAGPRLRRVAAGVARPLPHGQRPGGDGPLRPERRQTGDGSALAGSFILTFRAPNPAAPGDPGLVQVMAFGEAETDATLSVVGYGTETVVADAYRTEATATVTEFLPGRCVAGTFSGWFGAFLWSEVGGRPEVGVHSVTGAFRFSIPASDVVEVDVRLR